MSEAFDPYYRWLGIPPEEQPPNHYQLLGVQVLESNPEVIANAADRQMLHVRTFQAGPHGTVSQKLLNEIAAARMCLLHADQKAAYDRQLFAAVSGRAAPKRPPAPAPQPLPPAANRQTPGTAAARPIAFQLGMTPLPAGAGQPLPPSPPAAPPRGPTSPRSKRAVEREHGLRDLAGILAGGVAGAAIALCILWYGFSVDPLGVMAKVAPKPARQVADANHTDQSKPNEASKTAIPNGNRDPESTGRSRQKAGPRRPTSMPVAPPPTNAPAPANISPSVPATPPPPQPTIVARLDPFAQLPSELPIVATQGVYDLGPVSGDGANWTVSLSSELADLQGAYEFIATSADTEARGGQWLIQLQPMGSSTSDSKVPMQPVGRFFVENGRLKFEWTGDPTGPLSSQLLNAQVSLSDGEYSREFGLRQPAQQSAIALNLDEKANVVPLSIAAPPPTELLLLHVENMTNLPSGTQIEPTPAKLRVGDRLLATVPAAEELSAEIQLQFEQSGTSLDLRIRSWYRRGDRREEFTSQNITSDYVLLQKKIAQDQAELAAAESARRSIESSLASLSRRSPSTPVEAAGLRAQVSALQGQRGKALSTIRRLSTALPKATAAAKQLEAVANLGRQLHDKVQFHARLVAASGDQEITLLSFGNTVQR